MTNDRYETGHLVARSGELTQRIHWNEYRTGGTATDARRRRVDFAVERDGAGKVTRIRAGAVEFRNVATE